MSFKKKEQPFISFITPNYNDGNTIAKQVQSIFDQDYPNIEQIIVDDGSTDNSKEILQDLEKKYSKLKVIYLEKNKGACEARNLGAKEAKGKYLSFLPADAKLYPGVARIWVETLENSPEYDFVYGGYKFIDENGHTVFSYLSDDFDPYFLKVTNYIDGSFPLKKELFDKMGGWDTQIKSLQDWDFWLNAVLNHNAKGLYSRQEFFETTMPHPGGLSDDSHRNWIERTTQIKNKYNIPISKICVTGPGAAYHAKSVAKVLGADYLPNPSFKPNNYEMIYIIGFFGNVRELLTGTRALRVLHWIGSDIMYLAQADPKVRQETINWIDNNIDVNLCEMEQTRKELEGLGIKARIVPFPPQRLFEPEPLPEKPSVAVYLPYNNKEFYYPDFVYRVAKRLPDFKFHIFGDPTQVGEAGNVKHWGVLNPQDKEEAIKASSIILRITPHDGLPLSVIEWITAGRNAVCTIDIPHTNRFVIEPWTGKGEPKPKDLEKVVKKNEDKLVDLLKQVAKQGLNEEGSAYYRQLCDPEKFKANINQFLEIDIKEWWKIMSEFWQGMESSQETSEDIAKIIKEVKQMKPKNVLDIGCGTGRWADLLPVDDYTGIDFASHLIDLAREQHPDKKFQVADVVDFEPSEPYDLLFSFVCLLHVKPENIARYAEAMKKIAKRAILVEPIREAPMSGGDRQVHPGIIKKQKDSDFIFNIKYTWIHDYMRHFNVVKVVPMSHNRSMFIVEF